jgi:hypothetical protein
MQRIHGEPEYVKRTCDLAREVLRDLRCLEGSQVKACWTSKDPDAPQECRIANLYLVMPGKPEMRLDPDSGQLVPQVVSQAALMVQVQNFATGGVFDDDKIKRIVRAKVEEYLQTFTVRPGCNGPVDFRLGEWDYA